MHQEIENNLLKLHPVSPHWRDIGSQVHTQLNSVFDGFVPNYSNDFPDRFVNIQPRLRALGFPQESPNPRDYFRRSTSVPDDAPGCFLSLDNVRGITSQPPQTGAGVVYDGRQRLI